MTLSPSDQGEASLASVCLPEPHRKCTPDIVSLLVLAVLVALLFWTAPKDGSFWWSDSPRHALNGVFVSDLIAKHPFHHPVSFALGYYSQYPALTILFYPPLLYLISAPFFLIFGVSELVALIPIMLLYFTLAAGCYCLAKRWLPWPCALACAIALSGAPEVALWGRQVMLEIPCFAFVVWSLWCFLPRGQTGAARAPYWGTVLLLCAMYTKLTAVFLLPVVVLTISLFEGLAAWRERRMFLIGALFLLGCIPLIMMTLKFGQANIQSVVGVSDAVVPRWSMAGWVWYLRQLPSQAGWVPLLLGVAGSVAQFVGPKWHLPRRDALLLGAFFLCGYVFFSLISLKEARHSVMLLYPVVVMAIVFVHRACPERLSPVAALAVGIFVFGSTLWSKPVPRVGGYREAANYIADHAPRNTVVLFSGYRDGSFVFNMRARADRPDVTTIRADKLLLRVSIKRELGVKEMPYTEGQIASLVDSLGVSYVIAEKDFWADLAPMARLQELLHSRSFQVVSRIHIDANVPTNAPELVIYRNLDPLPARPAPASIDLPIIHRRLP